ncbi:hypothetical protein KTG15_12725, partial [Methanobacterium sp. YSL]|nr:hypothetical protein [Methanobacterium sp. YSL]
MMVGEEVITMRYSFERDFIEVISEIIINRGLSVKKLPYKANDYVVIKNEKTMLIFSYWPKSMVSTWQLSNKVVESIDLTEAYFNLRKVRIKKYPFRITMNVNIVRY